MLKKLSLLLSLVFIAAALKATDGQKIPSKVQKVIVFLNGAQVTRTAMVNISQGTSTLVFENISPGLDVQSIQVHADGEFTILSVKHEMNYLNEQAKQKNVEELQAKQKVINDKISLQANLLSVYAEERVMLSKNQVLAGRNSKLDIVKLKQALDFQTERLTGLKQKEQAINDQQAALLREYQKYAMQIANILKGSTTATSDILVTVSSKSVLRSLFTLSYVVHNAGWYPTYDIRAKNVNSPISITYKANVSQQCGEDWKDIKLTLSTGNPTVSGNKPELSPDYLGLNMYYANPNGSVTKVNGIVFANDDKLALPGATVKIKGTSIGTVTDVNGNYSLQMPAGNQTLVFSFIGYETQERPVTSGLMNVGLVPAKQSLNEVVVMGYSSTSDYSSAYNSGSVSRSVQRKADALATIPVAVNQIENQTNVEFNIDNPYSIPGDGKQYVVEISQVNIDSGYQYYVAPKISTDVFLTASITGWNKYNFLSGEANLFFEGTFIGKSLLDTHATTDTLNLSLGTDKNIVVTRTLQKELTERQSFGSNRKETRNWLIEIKNHKSQPVNLLVEDQVPVSQNSAIDVEVQELSGGKHVAANGKVSWNFLLNSQDDKKVQLKYMVKYPKNQSVIVQ
ncbi:DUF4139 domain-containing protein [soil metagenome]